jgi:hypothetical protein
MGRPLSEAETDVHTAAARLRKPAFYLDRLGRIQGGHLSPW